MAATLMPTGRMKFWLANGSPAENGFLYSFAAGTSTPLATKTDSGGLTNATNPVQLDANGEAEIYLGTSSYKLELRDADGAVVAGWPIDNIRSDYGQVISDFGSTTVNFGASLVGIQDAGGHYTGTNVEAALQEVPDLVEATATTLLGGAYIAATGTNTYVATFSPAIPAYVAGLEIKVKFTTANTTAATINCNGLGAKDIVNGAGQKLVAGQLVANQVYTLVYNGTNFGIQGIPHTEVRPGPRHVIQYQDGTHVYIRNNGLIQMGGFRFQGQMTKSFAPSYPTPQQLNIVGTLGAETSAAQSNWYAVFACANDGDTSCSFRIMPFLRAGSVAGSSIALNAAGEAVHTVSAKTYAWTATNNLANTDCLIISETIDGRVGNFSGRVTTITANTGGSVTLTTIGGVAAYDYILPAPPGFTHYCYLGTFLFDTSGMTVELRNIADSGTLVKAKMVNNSDPDWVDSGEIAAYISLDFRGYISPLATAVCIADKCTITTASAGAYAAFFATDSSDHYVHNHLINKEYTAASITSYDYGIVVPFSFGQFVSYKNSGSLVASRTNNNLEITGWIEP